MNAKIELDTIYPKIDNNLTGFVSVEPRDDCYFCTWSIIDSSGKNIAGKSFPISYQIISDNDVKVFIETVIRTSINERKIDQNKVFNIRKWSWL